MTTLMIFLIPLSLALCYALVLSKKADSDRRDALLLASVFIGALLAVATELLSQIAALTFWPIAFTWAAVCTGLAVAAGRQAIADSWRRDTSTPLSVLEKSMAGYLLLVLVITGVLVVTAPPNTWDSMTYHMSRVMHWMQAGTLDFYPTAILRQLHSNPWAEFAILHVQVLSGGDRFANAVQWLSMAGSLVGVSAIARELGADRRGQFLAAVTCASIPMGILQATSTQTDYAVGFWLVCFVYFGLKLMKGAGPIHFVGMGFAGGLAILTKATAYVFAFPFVLLIGTALLMRRNRSMWKWIATATGLAIVLNMGHLVRNFEFYGKPLGPGAEGREYTYTNDVVSFPAGLSNLVRNASLHLTSTPPLNARIQAAIIGLHDHVLGIDVNDPRTTWPGTAFQVNRISLNEDLAGNPLHFLLLVIACITYFLIGKKRTRLATGYLLALIVAYVAFCSYLKFQPWHSRLHLPLFILWTPFIGWLAAQVVSSRVAGSIAIALMLGSLPALLQSHQKPLLDTRANVLIVPRDRQYFASNPALFDPYMQASRVLRDSGCAKVGLVLGGNDWEYPLWALTNTSTRKISFEHVKVPNASAKLRTRMEPPCAIFQTLNPQPIEFMLDETKYHQVWSSEASSILIQSQ
jgi:hypothetical protein